LACYAGPVNPTKATIAIASATLIDAGSSV